MVKYDWCAICCGSSNYDEIKTKWFCWIFGGYSKSYDKKENKPYSEIKCCHGLLCSYGTKKFFYNNIEIKNICLPCGDITETKTFSVDKINYKKEYNLLCYKGYNEKYKYEAITGNPKDNISDNV